MHLKAPFFKKAFKLISATLISVMISSFVLPAGTALATINSTDYFKITAAGEATAMESGDTLTFTIQGVDSNGDGRAFSGTDYVFVEIMNPWPTPGPSTTADITAVGAGIALAGVGSGSTPYPPQAGSDISGTNNNIIKFNLADGVAVSNTVTVKATSSFQIFVWAPGAGINPPAEWDQQSLPGTDNLQITVGNATAGAHHLKTVTPTSSAEVGQTIQAQIIQVNEGGGQVATALTDLAVSVAVDGGGSAQITGVNGQPLEPPASSATDITMQSGMASIQLTVTDAGGGTLTISPASVTLSSDAFDEDATVTVSGASAQQIIGYGPPANQIGVPTMAPIDFMLSKAPTGTFPLTNTTATDFSITTGGAAVDGNWYSFTDNWGAQTMNMVTFEPNAPFAASTQYTACVNKSLAATQNLPPGMTALTDATTKWCFNFTTGTGGGEFTCPPEGCMGGAGPGFGGTMGGEVPPMAWLSYPMPGSWEVPTNISCINVGFDRPMDSSTLTTSNIYVKKMVNGTESGSLPSGSHTITATDTENRSVCIGGYTLEANSEYRVVVTRNVKDPKGNQLAGMPVDENGNPIMGFGFGFENMGPFKESFHTGAGSQTVTASIQGLNIDKYNNGGTITGVPVGVIIRANFNAQLSASTVNATNVTLKRNGSVPVPGNVYYDSMNNTVEFVPSEALLASTSYTFGMTSAVTSISGQAISTISRQFTTGAADSTAPQVAFVDADNYGIFIHFNEPMNATTAENRSYYTLKTCSGQSVRADGVKCGDDTTDPTPVSLQSGVNARYEKMENAIMMDGLTLAPGDGYYIEVANGVKDMAGNGVDASYKSWTGRVMDGTKFEGGQGMFTMGNMGFEDMDMGMMGMKPINVMPMNSMANATTKYFVDFPVDTQIPAGGYVELTFPSGFSVTGVKRDAQSPMNGDFNGPAPGTVTFANNITGLTGFTDGAVGTQPNDGIGYIEAARKVGVKLSAATQASDFMHFDLDGITNTSEPKDFDTAGYTVQIKTYDASGALIDAKTSMPFFISASGANQVSGRITAGATGLNGVKVFLGSPMAGHQETITANNAAGGGEDGEYKFSNLPSGGYMIFTEPMFTVAATDYYGQEWPEPLQVSGNTVKNFAVTAANGTNGATQPVSITFPDLSGVSNLGFDDSIDIFAGGPNGFVVKTVSRGSLGSSPYTTNLFLPRAGDWMIGIGPALPKGPMGQFPDIDWMPGPPTNVFVNTTNIGGAAMPSITIPITVADKTLSGKVVDGSGTAIANAEVFAYSPKMGKDTHAQANADGTFSLPITVGNYKVGAFLPGMPPSQEVPVEITDTQVFVGGSTVASTGSAGANPFILKIAKPDLTIQGRVSDGTNPIANAAVWAFRTDSPAPPVNGHTNQSGNYTLYVSAGTWKVEADAPGFGYLGSKTLTVASGTSLTGQNFTVSSTNMGTIQGTVGSYSGAIVWAWGPNGGNEAKTNTSGAYSITVPYGTYTVEAFVPGVGDMPPLTNIVVDGDETGNNFTVGTAREFTVTIKDDQGADAVVNENTIIEFFGTTGKGNNVVIPAGSSVGTVKLTEGEFYVEADVPGVPFDAMTFSGAEFNNVNDTPSTDNKIEIDGTGDNLTVTLPAMFTVSGRVTKSSTGVNDAFVNVFNPDTKRHFGVMTSNNAAGGGQDGEYTIKIPAGTYTFVADKPGSSSIPVDVTISANTTGNNLTMTANTRTITGTVRDGSSNPIANAQVWAEGQQGAFGGAETSSDGTFSIPVKESVFSVRAVAEGYMVSDAVTANTTSANVSGLSFSLTALTGGSLLKQPKTEPIIPISGGTVIDDETNTKIIVPPSALGTGQDAGQLITKETNAVMSTPTANPIGNGQVIEATDHNGNPITTLDGGSVKFQLELTTAELALEGITTSTGVDQITNGYWDLSTNNWVTMPTTKTYYDASNNVIPKTTVAGAQSLATANVDRILLTSNTDHFTTFAPILPSGSTPPATPSGLTATAGNTSVTLSWTANSEGDMSYYNIWEANVTEGVLSTLTHASCSGGTCSKSITGLTNGTAYSFQIIAVDTDGNQSAGSTAANATPAAPAAPAAPAGGGGGGGGSTPTPTPTTVTTDEETVVEETETTTEATEETTETPEPTLYTAQQGEAPFEDAKGHWGETYIADLYSRGIISGYDETTFGPDNQITRAEFTKIAINVYAIEVISELTEAPFTDVSLEDWFAAFVTTAKMANLVGGYEDGTFKPNQPINRAEAMKILLTAAGVDTTTAESANFPDVDGESWFAGYVNYAAQNQIVSGYEDGTFGPEKNMTRAEVSKVASLLIEKGYTD